MKILIVDDIKENIYLLEAMLKGAGYDIVSAVNGAEALEKLRAEGFDMIVSDILMPVMDGFKLCQECKADEKLNDIPFVFYTATYKDERDEELASKLGADKFLIKPIEPEEFVKIIQGIFRDVEEGKVGQKKPVVAEEKEVLKLYSERLITKLEKKMLDLEAETAQRKQAQEEVEHLNRVLRAIRSVNQLIITEKERGRLLKDACEILIQVREYSFAWIGLVEEGHKRVLPVAQAGFEEGYLDSAKVTWDDTATGKGPTGTAIKTKQPSLMKNIPKDPRFEPWRAEALEQGYLSSAAVPLVHNGKVYGALNVYSSQRDAFDDEETGLLVEVSGDLAFALHDMELEEEHKRAEEALQVAEQNFRNSLDNSPLGIRIVTAKGELLYANQAILDIYGYSSVEELKATPVKKRYTPESYAEFQERKEKRKLGKPGPSSYEVSIVRKDGEIRHLVLSRKEVVWGGEVQYQVIHQDITKHKQADEALRESEERYRTLFESKVDGVVVIDESGKLLLANEAAAEIGGFGSVEELLEASLFDFLAPDETERVARIMARDMFEKDLRQVNEFRARKKSGEEIWISAVGALIEYQGKPAGLVSFMDITEHKQAEEELRESEERYRNLFETTYDMIQSVALDGHFIFVNRAWLETLGYTEAELPGLNLFKIIHPESLSHCQEMFSKVMAGESINNVQATFVGKDGRPVLVEGNATGRYIGGKLVSTQGIFRDITERKQAEENLRKAAEEWRTTFDSITDLVFICDKDFRLVRVNRAFADAFKKKPEELIGKHCYEIVHGTNEPLPNCPHKVTMKTRKPATADFFEPHLGMHLELSTSPIFNEKGEVVASVHLIRDVTERKRMEEQLIVTDRLASIGELSSGIAHELNNPLTSVIGFSGLLLKKDLPDDIKEDLEVINREAQRTAGVVRNLLTFARKHPQEKESVDIHSIIQTVLGLRAYEQKVSNIQVITQFASDLPEITADAFQLQQVFINLVINAEHFMIEAHGRGTLTITTEWVGNTIRASFADDGPGIAKENMGHVFDPFFTTKEVGKGTGLGLSICHGIITQHGGGIYAESELGKGTTFVIELPVSK